jgi:hypothetical protein
MDKTTKIDNDHADEQIEVEGSSISSKSDENGDHDEFRKGWGMQRNRSNRHGRTPMPTRTRGRWQCRAPMSPHSTPISP